MRVLDEPARRGIEKWPSPDGRKVAKQPLWAVALGQRGVAIEDGGTSWRAAHIFSKLRTRCPDRRSKRTGTQYMEVFRLTLQAVDRRKLAKDILWAISQLGDGKIFIGHDSRKYAIVRRRPEAGAQLH
jgi:hypothetical protein